jgi:hypothetical protein
MSISHISVHLHTLRVVACHCTEPTRVTVGHHFDRLGVLAQRCNSPASRVGSGSGLICAPLEDCNICVARECDERLPVGRFVNEALRLSSRGSSPHGEWCRCRAVPRRRRMSTIDYVLPIGSKTIRGDLATKLHFSAAVEGQT